MKPQILKLLVGSTIDELTQMIIERFCSSSQNHPEDDYMIKVVGSKHKDQIETYITSSCPCCGYRRVVPVYREFGRLIGLVNHVNLEKFARGYMAHIEARVRLSGDRLHMNLMESIFGEEYTLSMIKIWHQRSVRATRKMKDYIDSNEKLPDIVPKSEEANKGKHGE